MAHFLQINDKIGDKNIRLAVMCTVHKEETNKIFCLLLLNLSFKIFILTMLTPALAKSAIEVLCQVANGNTESSAFKIEKCGLSHDEEKTCAS